MTTVSYTQTSWHEAYVAKPSIVSKGEVILIPTAAGLCRPLDVSYPHMANILADNGYSVRVIECSGQNGHNGKFSVFTSCIGLCDFLSRRLEEAGHNFFLFGICTGALAALFAARQLESIKTVIAWDMCDTYDYNVIAYKKLEEKFGVEVDWETALIPIQAKQIIRGVKQKLFLGIPFKSKCTNIAEQKKLCEQTNQGEYFVVKGVGHVPGLPRGSELKLAMVIKNKLDQLTMEI